MTAEEPRDDGDGAINRLLRDQVCLALTVAMLFCSRVDAGQQSFQSLMDDGRSADLMQNYPRAENAYSMAYQLAQSSNNPRDQFYSLAHLLCAKVVQRKYKDSEPFYTKLNAMSINLREHNKLEADMLEDIDDICDAYEVHDRKLKDDAPDPTYTYRMEHSMKLRMQFLKGTPDLIDDEHRMIGWHIRRHEFEQARELVEAALSNSSRMPPIEVARFETVLSCILEKTGAAQKAQAMQKSAFATCQRLNAMGYYYSELSRFSAKLLDLKSAIKFSTLAIKYFESPLNPPDLTEELTARGAWKFTEKDFAGAEADYKHALAVAKSSNECWKMRSSCYRGLAAVMHAEHNDKQADEYVALGKQASKQARKMEAKDFHDASGDFEAAEQESKGGH